MFACRGFERAAIAAHAVGKLLQNARNFSGLFLAELNKPVIQVDGFERLHEDSLSCAARPVNDAWHTSPVRRAHGNHKSLVAQRDVVAAARFATAPAQDTFERLLNFFAPLSNACPDAPQLRRCVVADLAVWKNRVPDRFRKPFVIRQTRPRGRELWIFVLCILKRGARHLHGIDQRANIQKICRHEHARPESRAAPASHLDP